MVADPGGVDHTVNPTLRSYGAGVDAGDLAALLDRHAAEHAVPAAALGILQDGAVRTAFHGAADGSTRFGVGSLTKSLVATAFARLAAAGRLSLDDPLLAHVPELRGSRWAERATLRDLLANRSGLPLLQELEFAFDDRPLARLLAGLPAATERSPLWSYTNVGWCVLGRALEHATGAGWEEAVRGLVLEPAGMRATGAAADPPLDAPGWGPAGTTLVSTVDDLLRFAALQLDDPALAVLRELHADVALHGWLDGWCLGLARFDWDGTAAWGWDGLLTGARAVLRLVPARRTALVLLATGEHGRALYRSLFAELVPPLLGARFPPLRLAPSAGAARDLARFAGVYAWPDRRVEVAADGGRLLLEEDGVTVEAVPLDERTFLVDAADPDTPTVTFGAFDELGRPGVLYLMLWGLPRTGV
jgi:CubicO group peptidase (beta-lactamase class C family)